eukprot:403366319
MHNRNSNAQRTLSGVSSTGALLQQQFQIPSTTSNPSLSNFANQQFANGSPDLQHQPTFHLTNQSQNKMANFYQNFQTQKTQDFTRTLNDDFQQVKSPQQTQLQHFQFMD